MMELEVPQMKDGENSPTNRFEIETVDVGVGSNPTEVIESVKVLISADDDTALFEVEDLELLNVSLKNGIFELAAIQRIYTDVACFQKAVEDGKLLRHTVRCERD